MRWHCPPDTGFEIRALAVWGRALYLSVTEAPHNTDFYTWMGKKHFCFFQTAETGIRTPNSSVKGSGANHYPRAPAQESGGNVMSAQLHNIASIGLITVCVLKKKLFEYLEQKNQNHSGVILNLNIRMEMLSLPQPFNRQIIQSKFSPTWSSSEWKLFRFDKNVFKYCWLMSHL